MDLLTIGMDTTILYPLLIDKRNGENYEIVIHR
jgi:hypothetical protein